MLKQFHFRKEYIRISDVTEHKYAVELFNTFKRKKPLTELLNWDKNGFLASADSIVFLDNYEDQHQDASSDVITHTDQKTYKMATAYMLAHPYGEPNILSSYNFYSMWSGKLVSKIYHNGRTIMKFLP